MNQYARRGTAVVFVVDALCRTLYDGRGVVEKLRAGFHILESLLQSSARSLYFAVADGFIVYRNNPSVAMAFQVVLTISGSTFEL